MEMDVPWLILNMALSGTNTSKTNRIGEVGEEDKSRRVRERGDVSEVLRAFHNSTGHENTMQGGLREANLT